jgi:hypothetical protein
MEKVINVLVGLVMAGLAGLLAFLISGLVATATVTVDKEPEGFFTVYWKANAVREVMRDLPELQPGDINPDQVLDARIEWSMNYHGDANLAKPEAHVLYRDWCCNYGFVGPRRVDIYFTN